MFNSSNDEFPQIKDYLILLYVEGEDVTQRLKILSVR